MEVLHHFIDDTSVLPDLAGRLWDAGYVPSFVTAQQKQTGAILYKVRLHAEGKTRFNSDPLDREVYVNTARAQPHRGIGVQCPVTRDPDLILCAMDIDTDVYEYQTLMASVIHDPCPVRFGQKGSAMMVTMRRDYDKEALVKAGIDGKNLGPPSAALECMGLTALQHVVLPPSRYGVLEDADTGKPIYYKWLPFPSRSPAKQLTIPLWDVRVEKLPCLSIFHLMEIRLHMHKKNSALAKLILGDPWSGPGDGAFRDRIREAVHFMVMEDLPDFYVEQRICEIAVDLLDVSPNPAWGEDNDALLDDVRSMSKGSRRQPSNPVVGRNGAKTPIERKMEDWLGLTYPEQDLRTFGGALHYWNSNTWELLKPEVLNQALYDKFLEAPGPKRNTSIRSWMERPHDPAPFSSTHLIYCLSGVADVKTMRLRPLTKEDYLVHPMQTKLDPKGQAPNWTAHITRMLAPPPDVEIPRDEYESEHQKAVDVFEEFIGYCMARSYAFQKALFIIGPPNCGKGTMWRVLRQLFPKDSVAGLPMSMLDSDDARLSMLGKLVNFGSEIGRKSQDVDQAFNQITAHEEVVVWKKNSNRYAVALDTRLAFDGNLPPITSDATGAFKRRAIILRCSALPDSVKVLSSDVYDATMLAELPAILARLCRAYGRLLERGRFDPPTYTIDEAEQTRINADPVAKWIDECVSQTDDSPFLSNGQVYAHFKDWLDLSGFHKVDIIRWGTKFSVLGFPHVRARVGGKVVKGRRVTLTDTIKGDY